MDHVRNGTRDVGRAGSAAGHKGFCSTKVLLRRSMLQPGAMLLVCEHAMMNLVDKDVSRLPVSRGWHSCA